MTDPDPTPPPPTPDPGLADAARVREYMKDAPSRAPWVIAHELAPALAGHVERLAEVYAKLRGAVTDAGFGIMETSGKWSIHDVSENGKAEDERTLRVATENASLEAENSRLAAEVERLKAVIASNPRWGDTYTAPPFTFEPDESDLAPEADDAAP